MMNEEEFNWRRASLLQAVFPPGKEQAQRYEFDLDPKELASLGNAIAHWAFMEDALLQATIGIAADIDWHERGVLPLGPALTADPRSKFVRSHDRRRQDGNTRHAQVGRHPWLDIKYSSPSLISKTSTPSENYRRRRKLSTPIGVGR